MKVAIIGDLHFGARNNNYEVCKMMNTFFTKEFFPYLIENNIKNVVCLGDLLDKRQTIDFTISSYIKSIFFNFFEKNQINLYLILGNHDLYFRQAMTINGPSQIVGGNKFIKIIDSPTKVIFGQKNFVMIPWICNENKEECLGFIRNNSSKKNLCLGHFELQGFKLHGNTYAEKGVIETTELDDYEYVFSGHFHSPSESGNVMYVGTPYELTWNDYGDTKRFICYDTDTETITEIPCKTKMYKKIFLTEETIKTTDMESLSKCHLKIIVPDTMDDKIVASFLNSVNNNASALSVQTIKPLPINEGEDVSSLKVEVEDPMKIMKDVLNNTIKNENVKKKAMYFVDALYKTSIENNTDFQVLNTKHNRYKEIFYECNKRRNGNCPRLH